MLVLCLGIGCKWFLSCCYCYGHLTWSKLCKSIPRLVLSDTYGINIARPGEAEDPDRCPTADEFLCAYSSKRFLWHGLILSNLAFQFAFRVYFIIPCKPYCGRLCQKKLKSPNHYWRFFKEILSRSKFKTFDCSCKLCKIVM